MKILQRIIDGLVSIDDSQSGFVPERDTTDSANAGQMHSSEQTYLNGLLGPTCLALEKTVNCVYRLLICKGEAEKDLLPREWTPIREALSMLFFCYLFDMLSIGRGYKLAVITQVEMARKTFRELLLVVTSHHPYYKSCGYVYSCVWSTIHHASGTWPLTKPNLQHLQHTAVPWSDRSTISCLRMWPQLGQEN